MVINTRNCLHADTLCIKNKAPILDKYFITMDPYIIVLDSQDSEISDWYLIKDIDYIHGVQTVSNTPNQKRRTDLWYM